MSSPSCLYAQARSWLGTLCGALASLLMVNMAVAQVTPPTIVILGDSLTAGYGLPPADAFPVRLQEALNKAGIKATVQNAGVSGDTTAGGRTRLDWTLNAKPDYVIVELGANDALRGLSPKDTENNLDAILQELKTRKIKALLAGMRAPPNLGRDYAAQFDTMYARLAAKYEVQLYPFFLDGVAGDLSLNQPDGIHPNAKGVAVIVARFLLPMKQFLNIK